MLVWLRLRISANQHPRIVIIYHFVASLSRDILSNEAELMEDTCYKHPSAATLKSTLEAAMTGFLSRI